jgi:hypothetical protein
MSMTELQQEAQKKYNIIMKGNGGDYRQLRLYNVRDLLDKKHLTENDILVLQHFINATRQEIDRTAYVANTAVYPMSWGHKTTVLARKNTKSTK